VTRLEDVWIPLVDEPIGAIVSQIQERSPDIERLVDSPRKVVAFRTFAYIRVGILLGRLLVEEDVEPYDGTQTWVERLLSDPGHRAAVEREVRLVAEEIAVDSAYADDEPLGPDEQARERFRTFARSSRAG
jgi:hypothetical protein